jgi:hypothetical protein
VPLLDMFDAIEIVGDNGFSTHDLLASDGF